VGRLEYVLGKKAVRFGDVDVLEYGEKDKN